MNWARSQAWVAVGGGSVGGGSVGGGRVGRGEGIGVNVEGGARAGVALGNWAWTVRAAAVRMVAAPCWAGWRDGKLQARIAAISTRAADRRGNVRMTPPNRMETLSGVQEQSKLYPPKRRMHSPPFFPVFPCSIVHRPSSIVHRPFCGTMFGPPWGCRINPAPCTGLRKFS